MGPGHFGRGSSLPGVAPCCAGEILKIQLGSYTRGHWVDQGVNVTTRPDSVNVTSECKEFSHLASEDKHTTVPGTAMDGGILLWFRVAPDPYLLKKKKWGLLDWVLTTRRGLEEGPGLLLGAPAGGYSLRRFLSVECRMRQTPLQALIPRNSEKTYSQRLIFPSLC